MGHVVVAHGVDHGLRLEASGELALVADLCGKLGISFEVTRVDVASGSNVQARARDARHRALQQAAIRLGATVIATGHTADDRAETVLLRLLRGAGPRGRPLPRRSRQSASGTFGTSDRGATSS